MASPNLSSAGSGTASASGSVGSGATRTTDIKAPLWDHVTILERPKAGGGNASWRCNYCGLEKCTSYTRVEAHLLQKSGKGIGKCPKVTYEMLSQMRMDVERCQELVNRAKQRTVSLPVAPSSVNNSKKKRGPASILIYDMIRFADTDTPCLHLIYEMWDSMIEKVKKEIYLHEGKEPNEESDLYSVIYDILIARWTKGNNPLHCLAHSLNPR